MLLKLQHWGWRCQVVTFVGGSWDPSSGLAAIPPVLALKAEPKIGATAVTLYRLKKGDRVHSLFFETWLDDPIKMNFDAKILLPIPEHFSYEEAATIHGDVFIFGAQLAKAVGTCVIATTSSKEKEVKYRALGVDEIIDYREVLMPEWSEVKELAGGKGAEQVLEVGTPAQSLRSIVREGYVHVIGVVAQGNPSGETTQDLALALLFGRAMMSGLLVGSKVICERLDAFTAEHKIWPVIDRVFGWTELVDALDYQLTGSHLKKIVVRID